MLHSGPVRFPPFQFDVDPDTDATFHQPKRLDPDLC